MVGQKHFRHEAEAFAEISTFQCVAREKLDQTQGDVCKCSFSGALGPFTEILLALVSELENALEKGSLSRDGILEKLSLTTRTKALAVAKSDDAEPCRFTKITKSKQITT